MYIPSDSRIESLKLVSFRNNNAKIESGVQYLFYLHATDVTGLQHVSDFRHLRMLYLHNTDTQRIDNMQELLILAVHSSLQANQGVEINNCAKLVDLTLDRIAAKGLVNVSAISQLMLMNGASIPSNIHIPNTTHFSSSITLQRF